MRNSQYSTRPDLTATVTNDQVTLSWNASSDPAVTGCQMLRRRPDQGEDRMLVHVSDTGGVQTEYVDTAVQPGKLYEYRVKAINGAGIGRRSNPAHITIGSSP